MPNSRLVLFALALLGPAPLAAQGTGRPERIRPKTCPLSDSLLTPGIKRPKASIMAVEGNPPGNGLLSGGAQIRNAQPIMGFLVSGLYAGPPEPSGPELSIQFEVADYKTRPIEEAILTLTLDDTLTIAVGQMQGRPNLAAGLSPRQARQLARANAVTGKLGSNAFALDERGLDAIRAVYVAASCGPRSR